MIWGGETFGGGSAFGVLYFANGVGLAPKKIADAETGEDSICDTRNGTDSLQYDENGVRMQAIGLIDFVVDTHFEARGRLGRLPAALTALKVRVGVGLD
jgi:cyanophycinase